MRRTPLTAMLTLLAVLASTVAVAGCGGKAASSSDRDADDEQHPDDHRRRPRTSRPAHKHQVRTAPHLSRRRVIGSEAA